MRRPTVALNLRSRPRRNLCEMSVGRRRQLASRRRLLQIVCQPRVSDGVRKVGSHWALLSTRLVTGYSEAPGRLGTALGGVQIWHLQHQTARVPSYVNVHRAT